MIRNYVVIAIRAMMKRKMYSFINAFGLSVAIAFCTLIYLYVQDEQRFDQFHVNKDRIYRMHATSFEEEELKKGSKEPYRSHPSVPAKLGEVMQDELAEVEYMTRYKAGQEVVMQYQDKIFKQNVTFADSGFFRMFSFRVVAGTDRKIFHHPSDAVLTATVAKKYFGDEDPIGKTFTLDLEGKKSFTVVAIMEEPPSYSSIRFEMLVPEETQPWFVRSHEQWGNFSYPTFVQLKPHTDVTAFRSHLDALTEKYMGEKYKKWREREKIPAQFKVGEFGFMPLGEIHLSTKVTGDGSSDPKYSWILGGIALLILVIACINYISLALTTSASRRVEVGIRKVAGAQKKQLIYQFSIESVLLAVLSMIIGYGLVALFLSSFNSFTGKDIRLTDINLFQLVLVISCVTVLVGLIAGSYPALYLSGFLPAKVLKGTFTSRLQAIFTRPLVSFQFALSSFLIISSIIMYRQMRYITTKDLGYEKDQLVAMQTNYGWNAESDLAVERFKNRLKSDPAVAGIAGTTSSFAHGWSRYGYRIKDENKSAYVFGVDTDYLSLLGIDLVKGRNFDERIVSDSNAVIVNEALVKDMGWKDPLSEHLNFKEDSTGLGAQVIGVVKDYHFLSLEREIEPMFLSMDRKSIGHMTNMIVKLAGGDIPRHLEHVRKAWQEMNPDKPFEYTFVDEDVAKQYDLYNRWMKIMGLSTGFAIVIACLGLFGLAGINAVNRTKEIGIRKVLGAEMVSIFILLNRQYVLLAGIAFAMAAPLSWWAMQQWLSTFKYQITIGWELFAISMACGLLLALVTVSYHAIRVSYTNPAETLKYE